MTTSHLELQFDSLWEYLFPQIDLKVEPKIIPKRKFRFDDVHLKSKVGIEINVGFCGYYGHSSGVGISHNYEKLNLAQSCGYIVFQLSGDMITKKWLKVIAQTIKSRRDV